MVIRLRLGPGPRVKRSVGQGHRVALAFAALLSPAALMACALAFWRIASDLGATGEFAIQTGLFSHWQTWFAVAAVIELAALLLNRYGRTTPAGLSPSATRPAPSQPSSRP